MNPYNISYPFISWFRAIERLDTWITSYLRLEQNLKPSNRSHSSLYLSGVEISSNRSKPYLIIFYYIRKCIMNSESFRIEGFYRLHCFWYNLFRKSRSWNFFNVAFNGYKYDFKMGRETSIFAPDFLTLALPKIKLSKPLTWYLVGIMFNMGAS